ncbi:unnamed protein product, partial [Oppiella nova]
MRRSSMARNSHLDLVNELYRKSLFFAVFGASAGGHQSGCDRLALIPQLLNGCRRCHLLRQLVVTHRHHLQVCPLVSHLSTRLSSATASSTAATQIKTNDSRFTKSGPDLQHFIRQSQESDPIRSEPFVVSRSSPIPYIDEHVLDGQGAKVFIRTYGCQMNVNDTQIATTILKNSGYDI